MPTEAEVLAALRGQLVTGLVDPNIADKRHIVREIGEIDLVNGISGGGGGTATTPVEITQGIDASPKVDTIRLLLADIKAELVNSTAIADIFIQDSGTTPRYLIRQDRIDQTTGAITVSILNLDGTIPSPAPVPPLLPVKAGSTNLINEDLYTAIIAGTGYAVGDSIANVRLLNGETSTVVASSWYNITTRSAIASSPAIADLKGYEDKLEELLIAIAISNSSIDSKKAPLIATTDAIASPTTVGGMFLRGYNGATWDRIRAGVSGAAGNILGYLNTIGVGKYNATPPTLTDGQWLETQIDRNGQAKITGSGFESIATLTRAANTIRYDINDVYGTAFELTNFGLTGGFVILSSVKIVFNIATLPAGMGPFLLFLYSAPPPSNVTDNNAFSVPVIPNDRAINLTPGGGIPIGNAIVEPGGGSVGLNAPNLNLQIKLDPTQTSVWGYLVTQAAFTPAAASETAKLTTLTLGV
ncbi:hypothetical protein [Chamaesiphon sp. OTE_8_metabat_110]|uniref:hypothetical protein n=1 Tax=Chamaesiphon sp. OTE_8_metabat_110 TaxID=2964696 RepID=UPI00286B5301|nr:hypothetical protein [Chamaesiphon sp. OTE_8_metabat_110]